MQNKGKGNMEDILKQHLIHIGENDLVIGENRIVFGNKSGSHSFLYQRYVADKLVSNITVVSHESPAVIGIFPAAPVLTPKRISRNLCLKFKSPVIVDQKSVAELYTKMPVEIAVYRQHREEEMLIDAFSLQSPRYTLYGSPESGVLCRYDEVEVSTLRDDIKPEKYKEALVRVRIRNDIHNVIKVTKIVIPMDNVILDHLHDDSRLPGHVEMILDHTFGKEVVNIHLAGTKIKRPDKTSATGKEDSLTFLMDAGY
jgi:hypothetical protein